MKTVGVQKEGDCSRVVIRKVLSHHDLLSLAYPCTLFISEGESHSGPSLRKFYFHEDEHSAIVIDNIVVSFAFPEMILLDIVISGSSNHRSGWSFFPLLAFS